MEFNKVRVIGVTTPVASEIPDSEGILSYAARVSSPQNQDNFDTAAKLLKYCLKHQHYSVFETVNILMEIDTPRDIARQLLRHRSFTFQEFCISGESLITTLTESGNSKKVKIKDLYKRYKSHYWGMSDNLVRVYDEKTGLLKSARIKEVFETGVKPVFELTLSNGKKVVSTQEHKFLTRGGFKELKDIHIGDFIGCNGIPVWQDKEWLLKAKQESLTCGGLNYISEKAGTSTHTIRKWLKKHSLQFSKKEVSQYTEIWNKGLPVESQPRFGKFVEEDTRQKMRDSANKGKKSNLYKNGGSSFGTISFERKCRQFSRGYLNELLNKQGFKCAITGVGISAEAAEVDHILPVYSHPEKAFHSSNLQALSKEAHLEKSIAEMVQSRKTACYSQVVSIEFKGDEQTYDMEIDHESHNYIANGVVTHNSQRYAVSTDFILREARLQDDKNRQNSVPVDDECLKNEWSDRQKDVLQVVQNHYKWALENGIAKECARVILPEGNTMSKLYVNGTLRSWIHYSKLRAKNGTQLEHSDLALKVMAEDTIMKYFPFLEEVWNDI